MHREVGAVCDERLFHLVPVDPALDALVIPNQVPIGPLHDDLDGRATVDNVEYRVAASGSRMQFQIRFGDGNFSKLLGGRRLFGVEGQ